MHNPIVNYGRFPSIVSVQCLEHKQLSRILDALTNVRRDHQETWETEAVMENIPNVPHWPATGVAVSGKGGGSCRDQGPGTRAPRGHSTHRPVAPAPPDSVSPRCQSGQPRVYKAITACPGSWIIRVQADIMKVGCVLSVCCSYITAGFSQCSAGSVTSWAKNLISFILTP